MVLRACATSDWIDGDRPQRVAILQQALEVRRGRRAGRRAPFRPIPLEVGQKLEVLLVEMAGLAEHQIGLQIDVQFFRLRGVLRQTFLHTQRKPRQQRCRRAPADRRRARNCRPTRPDTGPSASPTGVSSDIDWPNRRRREWRPDVAAAPRATRPGPMAPAPHGRRASRSPPLRHTR